MTPTGREACNSSAPYQTLSDQFGLWDYGTVGRSGTGFNDVLRPWRFRLPDTTRFVFRGHVVADLVTADPNPPTTVAIPGAGTYAASQSVELRCTDAETGCAATYYTTDGTEPTTSSPVYGGAISVASSFTLRFFSVDYWGNAEAVQSADYVLDDTAPYVVSTDPADGDTGVPLGTLVAITFSEPMDTGITPGAIALDGPDGPVPGTVTWDGEGRVFTFAPAAPLAGDTSYTLSIQPSARDLAGNQLASTYTASFTTRSLIEQVSGPGSATLEPGGIAFDGSGNGLAVWRAVDEKILYSCYGAASGTWSPAAVLDTVGGGSVGSGPRVAASTSGFAVAWYTGSLNVSLFTGCTPGPAQSLATGFYGYNHAIGSNGSGFLVIWSGTQYGSFAALFDGAGWSQQYFTTDTYLDALAAAGEGTGYRIVYRKSSTTYSVRYVNGAWSSRSMLGAGGGDVAVASEGGVTCMAWQYADYWLYGRIEVGGSGTTSTIVTGGIRGSPSVAMNGGRCQAVIGTSSGAVGVLHDGAAWGTAASLRLSGATTTIGVARWGTSDFAAAAVVDGNLWVSRTAASSWQTPMAAESSSEPVRSPMIAAASSSVDKILFAQADARDEIWTVDYDGGSVSAHELLSTADIDGSSFDVKMAATANGDALAIWTQEHQGRNNNVFWALRQGGTWGTAQLLATDAQAAAVASNGTDFMVAYRLDISSMYPPLVTRRFSGGSFGAAMTISSGNQGSSSEMIASDGTGYAIAYVIYTTSYQAMAQIFDGASWGPPKSLTPNKCYDVSIAGRPGEYLTAWIDQNGSTISVRSWRAVGSGASWAWEASSQTILASGAGYIAVALAAGPGGFAAAYPAGSGAAAAIMSGGTWSAPTTLRSGTTSAIALASNGTTYMAVISGGSTGTQIHAWNGSWQAARSTGHTGAFTLTATSGGEGYGIAAGGPGGPLAFISVPEPISGAIGATVGLNTCSIMAGVAAPLVVEGGGYLAAWNQCDPADPAITRIYARGGL